MPPNYRMPYGGGAGGGMRGPASSAGRQGPLSPGGGAEGEVLDEEDNLWSRKKTQTQREVLSAVEKARQKRGEGPRANQAAESEVSMLTTLIMATRRPRRTNCHRQVGK